MCQFTSLLTEHFDYLQKVSVYFGVWRKQGIEGNVLSWGLFSVTWKIYMVVWFTSLCLMPSHSRGLLVWESKIMATSPFFVVLVLFLIILPFVQYPSNTMVRAQLDSKDTFLTLLLSTQGQVLPNLVSLIWDLTRKGTSMVRVGHWHAILVCLVSMETENKPP